MLEFPARSIACRGTNALRGMDAIHIGGAIALKADVFIYADRRQCDAADRSGLQVELDDSKTDLEQALAATLEFLE